MGEQKKERKNNLITFRLTDEDMSTLDLLSDCMDGSISDTLLRACKFFLNMGDNCMCIDDDEPKKERKKSQVHLRVSDSDMQMINSRREKNGESISQIFRKAIREYDRFKRNHY